MVTQENITYILQKKYPAKIAPSWMVFELQDKLLLLLARHIIIVTIVTVYQEVVVYCTGID